MGWGGEGNLWINDYERGGARRFLADMTPCREQRETAAVTVATWHLTSQQSGARSEALTATEKQGEQTIYLQRDKKKKFLKVTSKRPRCTNSYPLVVAVGNHKPFSLASPCKDRFHPGPWTISEKICLARTYPTLSSLGNVSFSDN